MTRARSARGEPTRRSRREAATVAAAWTLAIVAARAWLASRAVLPTLALALAVGLFAAAVWLFGALVLALFGAAPDGGFEVRPKGRARSRRKEAGNEQAGLAGRVRPRDHGIA